jgi:hypothetical protein
MGRHSRNIGNADFPLTTLKNFCIIRRDFSSRICSVVDLPDYRNVVGGVLDGVVEALAAIWRWVVSDG